MDAGIARISNIEGAGSTELRSGNLYTSRFGLRGAEDLGAGLKANFNLEAGLNADTGATSAPYFNRQSWVGLSSSSFGDISMGRMLPVVNDIATRSLQASYFGNASAALEGAATGAGSSAARFNNMIGGARVDNAIKYQSPLSSGFKVYAMTALGEVSGSSSAGRVLSLASSYESESFEAGAGYHETQCKTSGGCNTDENKDKIFVAVAAYKTNGARYAVTYTNQRNALNERGNDANMLGVMARVPVDQWVFQGGLQYLEDKSALKQDVRQANFGVNYLLSKRTQLYGLYSHQSVKNGGKAGMYAVTSSKSNQSQLSFGMVHSF